MMKYVAGILMGLIALGFAGQATVRAMPESIQIQGVLRNGDESPLMGTRQWRIEYHDAATGGNALGTVLAGQTVVSETGRWSIALTPPTDVLDAAGDVWYSIGIDSATIPDGSVDAEDVFSARVRVDSVLYAQRAREAQSLAGVETGELITEAELQALLADRATLDALDAGLAGKADLIHDHDDRYSLLGHNHNGVYALVVHTHDFAELTGMATDAQIPDNITIDFAAAAGSASTADNATTATFAVHSDTATTATVALALDGFDAADYSTDAELIAVLATKSDTGHGHGFDALTGMALDAQIPDNITIDFATAADSATTADNATTATFAVHADTATTATVALNALTANTANTADTATTAAVALALDGFDAADYSTGAELATGLAGKADSVHGHNFTELSGTAADAQIPDNITIDFATAAGSASTADTATTATFAVHADTATTATFANTADISTTATVALNALTANTANTADSATTAAVALSLDGTVTDAQVPDNITITEADTLDSVTGRGSSTANSISVSGLNASFLSVFDVFTDFLRAFDIDTEMLRAFDIDTEFLRAYDINTTNLWSVNMTASLLTLGQIVAPGVTTNRLYNEGGNLFWDGTQLNADADTLAGISGGNGDVLTYNSGNWAAAAPSGGGAASFSFVRLTSDDSSVTSSERNFGQSAPSTEVKQGSDVLWDSLFREFYFPNAGFYEVHFDGGVYSDGSSPDYYTEYEVRLFLNGVQQTKTRIYSSAYLGEASAYATTLRWVGSISAGDILEIRYANTANTPGFTPDPIGLQEGASVMVRKLD